jgi:SAM-dependent methyltransferase
LASISLKEVQAVYDGAEGALWELIMGEQIHIGGFASSMDLADTAGIEQDSYGVDLCCCNGAGMRFLVRFRGVSGMTGVDATTTVVDQGRKRCAEAGFADKIGLVLADVCDSGLPSGEADFVWGEDAWCYVADKPRLIAEAARLVKPGGRIAFTDWVEGPEPLSDEEAARYLAFMKFPNILSRDEYCELLQREGCAIDTTRNTGRFAPCVNLYLSMLNMQLTYDALKIIRFDSDLMQVLAGEMVFIKELADAGKISQGLVVATKKG